MIRSEIHVLDSQQISDDIEREIQRARKCLIPRFIVVLLDIENCRAISEGEGAKAGEEAVKAIGDRLGPLLSPRDAIANLGGGRMAVIADTSGHYDKPEEFARDLQRELESGITIGEKETVFLSTAGIAWVTATCDSPETVLANAGIALVRARREGLGTVIVFHDWMRDADIALASDIESRATSSGTASGRQ